MSPCDRCGETPAFRYKQPGWDSTIQLCASCVNVVRRRRLDRERSD